MADQMSAFVVCESVAAITPHLRLLAADQPLIKLGWHSTRPLALCGTVIAWDTKLPLTAARCATCRERSGLNIWPGFEHR